MKNRNFYSKLIKKAKFVIIVGLIITVIHLIHALTLDKIVVFNEFEFFSYNLPQDMNGYRVAFVTDPHYVNLQTLQSIVEELNERNIDLLLLGGDFARTRDILEQSMEVLAGTNTTDGIFGVEGNHDSLLILATVKEANGIGFLVDEGFHVREGFFLAGVRDRWRGRPDVAQSIYGSNPDDFILLLSHQPDVVMEQSTVGIDLILSGHLHGGQITFFGILAPALLFPFVTDYGQRFMTGFSESLDGVPIYTSRGVGHMNPNHMFRVFARPEVVIFTLYSK